jgi:hypothetical protein
LICGGIELEHRHYQPRSRQDHAGDGAAEHRPCEVGQLEVPQLVSASLLALRGDASANDPVFASHKGDRRLTERTVGYMLKRTAKRAGIAGTVSPHWLRHAHGSHALDRGATLAEVQTTLGHANVATTSGYLHARPNTSSGLKLDEGIFRAHLCPWNNHNRWRFFQRAHTGHQALLPDRRRRLRMVARLAHRASDAEYAHTDQNDIEGLEPTTEPLTSRQTGTWTLRYNVELLFGG